MNLNKMIKIALLILIIFIIVFSILIYGFRREFVRGESVLKNKESESEYIDRAYIVEKSEDAFDIRMNMLDDAKEKVDIAYYKIDTGDTSKIFLGKVLETAERGVKVRIYLDGILNNLKGNVKYANYAFADHPNIEYRLHQPLNIFKPWTFNNRLHDKIIIVDDKLAIIGGRNIGNRFFVTDYNDRKSVFDRDVLIYNKSESKNSVIMEMKDYFNLLWTSEGSVAKFNNISNRKKKQGKKFLDNLINQLKEIGSNNNVYNKGINWEDITKPIKKSEFVHNSLKYGSNPVGLIGILELSEMANEEIIAQSPYIILSRNMLNVIDKYDVKYDKMRILTNSYYSTPNIMAISGYHNIRKNVVDNVKEVNEYHEGNSIHGKSYVFDEKISVIGSFNLDPRSAYLSTEAYLVIYDEDLSKNLKSNIENLMEDSIKVDKDYEYMEDNPVHNTFNYKFKKLLIKFLSNFTYFFDYLL